MTFTSSDPQLAARCITLVQSIKAARQAPHNIELDQLVGLTDIERLIYIQYPPQSIEQWESRLKSLHYARPLNTFEILMGSHATLSLQQHEAWRLLHTFAQEPISVTMAQVLMARPEYHKVHAYLTDMPVEMYALYLFSLFQHDIPLVQQRTTMQRPVYLPWPDKALCHSWVQQAAALNDKETFQAMIEDPRMQKMMLDQTVLEIGFLKYPTLRHALAQWADERTYQKLMTTSFRERIREIVVPLQGKPVNAPREMHNGKLVMGLGRYVKFHTIEQARAMAEYDPLGFLRQTFQNKPHSKIKADDLKPLLYHALSNLAPWMQFYNTLPTQCALLELELSTFVKHPEWLTFVTEHHPKESALWRIVSDLYHDVGLPNTEILIVQRWKDSHVQHQHDTLPMPLDLNDGVCV